jgi:hypothetical protein
MERYSGGLHVVAPGVLAAGVTLMLLSVSSVKLNDVRVARLRPELRF